MNRAILLFCATLAATTPVHASALLRPVCAEPEVLLLVAERLRRAGIPQTLEANTAGQIPGLRSGMVECAVRVHTAVFDTTRYGRVPVDVVSTYRYSLRLGRNGVFVQPASGQEQGG